jgi:UDP-glucose 4-epimerase
MKVAVTGGAGFIGSHLADRLLKDHEVKVVDNFSSGRKENVSSDVELVEIDLKKGDLETEFSDIDTVFHFAANPRVNTFPDDRDRDFEENLAATKNVLDACVDTGVEQLVFASSSVVYGEDVELPTPETAALEPISMYGATKAGGEHICQVYSQIFGLDLTVVRLANIVGSRNNKGVIYDFIQKLESNPDELEILGNGKQRKSYLHITDTVDGIITAWNSSGGLYNIGNQDSTSVDEIADIVSSIMDLEPEFSYTGGEKGWKGDVTEMRLDISKLEKEGWSPTLNSSEAVRKTAEELCGFVSKV